MILSRRIRLSTILACIVMIMVCSNVQAGHKDGRDHGPKENDTSVLINIHNMEKFLEFRFDTKTNRVYQLSEGLVKKTEEGGITNYTLSSKSFQEKHLKNLARRNSILIRYGGLFSLRDESIVGTSKSEKYISYIYHSERNTFNMADLSHGSVILRKSIVKRIRDIAWIDDKAVCLLTSSTETSMRPWDILSTLSGHPPPYESFFLEIYAVDGDKVFETPIFQRLKYGDGHIVIQ